LHLAKGIPTNMLAIKETTGRIACEQRSCGLRFWDYR
jgi:hypothetical protein